MSVAIRHSFFGVFFSYLLLLQIRELEGDLPVIARAPWSMHKDIDELATRIVCKEMGKAGTLLVVCLFHSNNNQNNQTTEFSSYICC